MYRIERIHSCQIEELGKFMADSKFLWNDVVLLRYIIERLSRFVDDNVVVTHNGRIVGCNLYFHTMAAINGEIRDIMWSHSTYLAPEHRRHIGLEFIAKTNSAENIWGFGLTETNRKIHKMTGNTFCGKSRAYIVTPSCSTSVDELHHVYNEAATLSDPDSKEIIPLRFDLDGKTYIKCFSKEEHKMPNEGFWNPQILNVDFLRNRDFMEKRFYNLSSKYHVYKSILDATQDELYFVFKIQSINGVKAIFLVDYRFNLSDTKGLSRILDCLCHIAKSNSIWHIYIFTTLPPGYVATKYATITPYGSPTGIVTNSPGVSENTLIMVTPADSDCELAPL